MYVWLSTLQLSLYAVKPSLSNHALAIQINSLNMLNPLKSVHIIERLKNKNLLTWNYPTISGVVRKYLIETCFCAKHQSQFLCSFCDNHYLYFQYNSNFAIVLISSEFDLVKYEKITAKLVSIYLQSRDPVNLVQYFLHIITKNTFKLDMNVFDFKEVYTQTESKALFNLLQKDFLLPLNALINKERVLVYHQDINLLQKMVWTLSRFAPEVKTMPFLDDQTVLKGYNSFVAGCTTLNSANKQNYDMIVNLMTSEVILLKKTKDLKNEEKLLALLEEEYRNKEEKDFTKIILKQIENNAF